MNSTLKFKYSKKQLRTNFLFGILWIIIFLIYYFFRNTSFFGYAYLTIGILFLGTYVYRKVFHYAIIKDGVLIKNDVLPKRIKLDEITDVIYYAGKYQLKTDHSEMTINTIILDKTSVEDLKKIIKQINFSKS